MIRCGFEIFLLKFSFSFPTSLLLPPVLPLFPIPSPCAFILLPLPSLLPFLLPPLYPSLMLNIIKEVMIKTVAAGVERKLTTISSRRCIVLEEGSQGHEH